MRNAKRDSFYRNFRVLVIREYLDAVSSKVFWISVIATPILIVGMIIFVAYMIGQESAKPYVVIDKTGWVAQAIRQKIQAQDMHMLIARGPSESGLMMSTLPEIAAAENPRKDEIIEEASFLVAEWLTERSIEPLSSRMSIGSRFAAEWTANYALIKEQPGLSHTRYPERFIAQTDETTLWNLINSDQLWGYFVLAGDIVGGESELQYASSNLAKHDLRNFYENFLRQIVRTERVKQSGIDPEVISWITSRPTFAQATIDESGDTRQAKDTELIAPYIPMGLLYIMWFMLFVPMMSNMNATLEDRNNKVMEVMLSALDATGLLYGKIVASMLSTVTMVLVWASIVAVALAAVVALSPFPIPTDEIFEVLPPFLFVQFVVYLLLAYALFAPLICAIGANCNSAKETQPLIAPLTILLVFPLAIMFFVVQDPEHILPSVMTFVPIWTPFMLMLRAASEVPVMTYVIALSMCFATIVLFHFAAVRLFERGVLKEGPSPTLFQVVKLLKGP